MYSGYLVANFQRAELHFWETDDAHLANNSGCYIHVKDIVGRNDHSKVAYGAEAGLFLRELGLPTVLCGPGSISVAHRPDEFVERIQLAAADLMLRRAAREFCKSG